MLFRSVPISEDELRDPTLIKRLAEFDADIETKLGKFDPGTAMPHYSLQSIFVKRYRVVSIRQEHGRRPPAAHSIKSEIRDAEYSDIQENNHEREYHPELAVSIRLSILLWITPGIVFRIAYLVDSFNEGLDAAVEVG